MTLIDEERTAFEPIGEQSRRQMIHDGLASLAPLEPNSVITYNMVSEWIGEPFPIPRATRNGEFLVPDYGPMDAVKDDLHRDRIHLVSVPNIGYRVATDEEALADAERRWHEAARKLGEAAATARCVNPSRVGPAVARQARTIDADVLAERRVLAARARQRAKERTRW